jgi:hypothetical protein
MRADSYRTAPNSVVRLYAGPQCTLINAQYSESKAPWPEAMCGTAPTFDSPRALMMP